MSKLRNMSGMKRSSRAGSDTKSKEGIMANHLLHATDGGAFQVVFDTNQVLAAIFEEHLAHNPQLLKVRLDGLKMKPVQVKAKQLVFDRHHRILGLTK